MTNITVNSSQPSQQIVNASSLTLSLPFDAAQDKPRSPIRFYRHGWQSWSLAAWIELTPIPVQRPVNLHPLQIDPIYSYEAKPNSSWIGAVEFADGNILLLGAPCRWEIVFLKIYSFPSTRLMAGLCHK